MKKAILFASLMLSVHVYAQKIDQSKVPSAVKSTFASNFPLAGNVNWENEKGNYEANFVVKGNKMSALFDVKGTWLETERNIDMNKLPKDALEYVNKNYKGKIQEVSEIKKANNEISYEAHVVKGADLMFNAQGKFLQAVKD